MPLLWLTYRTFRNTLRSLTLADGSKSAFFGFWGLLCLLGLYVGFTRVLRHLAGVPLIGELLILKLLAMTFLLTFLMVIFSSLITSFTTLFDARDLNLLLVSPLSVRKVFFYKALENAFYASWMVWVALVPFLFAYGRVKALPFTFYLASGALAAPFLWTAAAVGLLIGVLLMWRFPSARTREIVFITGILVWALLWLWVRMLRPERILKPDELQHVLQYIAALQAPTAVYLPSWWMTEAVYLLSVNATHEFWLFAWLLFLGAAGLALLVSTVAGRVYLAGWGHSQEHGSRIGVRPRCQGLPPSLSGPVPVSLGGWPVSVWGVLWRKDLKTFFREPNQWTQVLLLFSITVIYVYSISHLPLDAEVLRSLISFLNIGLVGFILASVALRLVYPAVSLEGSSFWILRAAPFPLRRVLFEKWVLASVILGVVGTVLVWSSTRWLGVDLLMRWLSVITVALFAVSLGAMGVGLGSASPRFQVRNVAQIETSPGGLFFMICALFYVGLTLSIQAWPVRTYFATRALPKAHWPWSLYALMVGLLVLLNVGVSAASLWYGHRSLQRYEI